MRQSATLFLLFLGLLTSTGLRAQVVDSLKQDKPSIKTAELDLPAAQEPRTYVPRRALMWSIIPGGGQVYNRRWWKVPLVFSAFSGVYAVLDFNQSTYQRFDVAYQLELAGEQHEFSFRNLDASALRVFRDNYNKQRQTNYFMLVAVYLLQGVEAYVDTHLRNFDMDEDLSQWQVMPQVMPSGLGQPATVVLQLQYSF